MSHKTVILQINITSEVLDQYHRYFVLILPDITRMLYLVSLVKRKGRGRRGNEKERKGNEKKFLWDI